MDPKSPFSGPNLVEIGSKSGPNQVRAEGFSWVGAGGVGPGGRVPVAPLERLYANLGRRAQKGCGGLGGEYPEAFPKAQPIFQQPLSLPENAQTLAGIACHAAGKSVKNFPAASKFARKPFQQGISGSHSLLEFSEIWEEERVSLSSGLFGQSLSLPTTSLGRGRK